MQSKQLGSKSNPKPVAEGDRVRQPNQAAGAAKEMIVRVGDQVQSVSKQVGQASAPYLYGRAMNGLMEGLTESFAVTPDPFADLNLELDNDFLAFPPTGGGTGETTQRLGSKSLGQKALSPKASQ